jgi:hypothetical protein
VICPPATGSVAALVDKSVSDGESGVSPHLGDVEEIHAVLMLQEIIG